MSVYIYIYFRLQMGYLKPRYATYCFMLSAMIIYLDAFIYDA